VLLALAGLQSHGSHATCSDDLGYDFIIMGGGTSGTLLARRLSENPNWCVLVLEEGAASKPDNNIPLNVYRLPRDCSNSFGYMYEPSNDYCLAMNNQQCSLVINKGLGGQSLLGDMIYNRGNRRDFDTWCKHGHSQGWCYKNVLPYYKKLENFTIPGIDTCGKGGPITVSYPGYRTDACTAFMNAGKEMGYPWVNYNNGHQTGFSLTHTTLKNGLRQNAYDVFLADVADKRPNLDIRTELKFKRLLFERVEDHDHHHGHHHKQSKIRVVGVEYDQLGFPHTVKARREVILATSSVEIAHLMMLSGVGPADHLKEHGIEVVKNLPVGHNYHDIVAIGGLVFFSNSAVPDLEKTFTKKGVAEFLKTRTGPASSPVTEALAFMDSSKATCDWPDFQLAMRAGSIVSMPMRRRIYNLNETKIVEHYGEIFDRAGTTFGIFPTVSRPQSRGRVLLQSANYKDMPIVRANFYEHPADMKVALAAIKNVLKLIQTDAFKAINVKFFDKKYGPCAHHEYTGSCDDEADEAYWTCYARHFTFPVERWAGTTKMGRHSDPTAVVDSEMRVHGIHNLRVVSAAVNPQQITGHLEGYRYMLGEKAADMICKYHRHLDKKDKHHKDKKGD
jgi:choline dehydrogenase-like flavoprotein